MHVIMHTFLYAVLGILLTSCFKLLSIQSELIILGLVLLVGCFHEDLQILTAGQWPGWSAEIFDLSADLVGAAVGLALARFWTRRKKQSPSHLPKQFSGPPQ